jgi:hypothetical protein
MIDGMLLSVEVVYLILGVMIVRVYASRSLHTHVGIVIVNVSAFLSVDRELQAFQFICFILLVDLLYIDKYEINMWKNTPFVNAVSVLLIVELLLVVHVHHSSIIVILINLILFIFFLHFLACSSELRRLLFEDVCVGPKQCLHIVIQILHSDYGVVSTLIYFDILIPSFRALTSSTARYFISVICSTTISAFVVLFVKEWSAHLILPLKFIIFLLILLLPASVIGCRSILWLLLLVLLVTACLASFRVSSVVLLIHKGWMSWLVWLGRIVSLLLWFKVWALQLRCGGKVQTCEEFLAVVEGEVGWGLGPVVDVVVFLVLVDEVGVSEWTIHFN